MKTLHIISLSLFMAGCANAGSNVVIENFNLTGVPLPSIKYITDMKIQADTLLFVYEREDGYGQRFLRRGIVDIENKKLDVSPDMGKRDDGYYTSYMPYPIIAVDQSINVIDQDDCEIYTIENDTAIVRTKQYLMGRNSTVPFALSQYVQDAFMSARGKYIFIGREPNGGRQYAMNADLTSATIDTICQISISPELQTWMPNAGELAYSSKYNRLAFAYRLHPAIEIFNSDGSKLKAIEVSPPTFNIATLEQADFENLNPLHFVDISTNSNYIYALYWGHKYGEKGAPKIYQLDWTGKIIARHALHDNVYKIAVFDDNTLIGWTGNKFVSISL